MSKKLILALIASGFLGFVLINLSLARARYRRRALRRPEQPPFFGWWLKNSAISLTVVTFVTIIAVAYLFFSYFDIFNPDASRYNHYLTNATKYSTQKKYKEAVLELRNAIQLVPNDPRGHLGLARMLWAMGDIPGAMASYATALKIDPDYFDVHLDLGRLKFGAGETDGAVKEIEAAAALKPNAPEPRQMLAEIYLRTGKADQAAAQYRAILTTDPSNRENRERLITLYLARRSFDDAVREAEAGLKQLPMDTGFQVLLARALDGQGRTGDAVALLEATVNRDTLSPEPPLALGDLRYGKGEYLPALKWYEEALKRSPDNVPAMNNIALLIADHGYELERAADLAARLYTRYPKDPAVVDTMGWVLFKQGKLDQALPLLRFAATGAPNNPVHRYHYGAALLKVGQTAAGRKELETALRISGNFDGVDKARALLGRK
jgi:tetratricopeptide (TPR) repeat protein